MPQVQEERKAQNTNARAQNAAATQQPRRELVGDYASQMAALDPNQTQTPTPTPAAPVAAAAAKEATPAPPAPEVAKTEGLAAKDAAAAVTFNKAKGLKPEVWAQVAQVVASPTASVDAALCSAIAAWQKAKGLTSDGKVGDISMQWLSMDPGGAGLELHVKSNAILYMGMNPKSKDVEHQKLAGSAGAGNVTAVKGSKKQGNIGVDGKDIDLGTSEGLDQFVASLKGGLDDGRRQLLKTFIETADFASKDELAAFAKELHRAECGAALFKRVVLSGHSNGMYIWGDDNGFVPFESLAVLHQIFPIATGSVEDLCLSACNTGQSGKLAQYKAIFPNVKSIWAYVGYSPDASGGALTHIGNWEKATRGNMNADSVHAGRKQTGKGGGKNDKHVAVLTDDKKGNQTYETDSKEATQDFDTLKAKVDSGTPEYDKAYQTGVINKQLLSALYTNTQNLIGMFAHQLPDLAKYELMLKHLLYLRYWDNITKKFTEAHGSTVKAGYTAASKTPVSYAGMTRDKALAAIAAYPTQGDAAHGLLVDFLKDLNPAKVPVTWA